MHIWRAHTHKCTNREGDVRLIPLPRALPNPPLHAGSLPPSRIHAQVDTGKFVAVKQITLKGEHRAAAMALRREIDVMIKLPPHRNMCVCVCVCVCARARVCVHTYMHTYTYI